MRGPALAWVMAASAASVAAAQGVSAVPDPLSPDPSLETTAPGIPGVVAAGTRVQFLRAGFRGTEGVISMPDGSVLFCELEADRVIHIDLDLRFSTYLEDANRPLGLAYDRSGRLIATQSREPRVGVLAPERATLVDSFEGLPLVRPNDLVVDSKGGIYFSDPLPTPQMQFRDPPPGRQPLLFYLTAEGSLRKLVADVARPNGLTLSTDERVLYAVNGGHILAFDVQPDGSVTNPRAFAEVAGDGLAMDSENRLYVATGRGIQVIGPSGDLLGLIPTPVGIQSIAFAGVDRGTLFAVGRGAVYRVPLLARGVEGRAK